MNTPNPQAQPTFPASPNSPSPGNPGEGWGEGSRGEGISTNNVNCSKPSPFPLPDYRERGKRAVSHENMPTPSNPPDLIWLNGETLPLSQARIGIEDRGFQFADGVYEVIRFYNATPFTLAEHLARLQNSAQGIQLSLPLPLDHLSAEIRKLIAQSTSREGMVYLQLTRGVAPRNHAFPAESRPTLLFYTRPLPPVPPPGEAPGVKLCSVPDERWKRCWIKSIALLPNILAKNHALTHGYDEAAFLDNGLLCECSASNLFMIHNQTLITHPVGPNVLPGITRATLLALAPQAGLKIDQRPLRQDELLHADEAFITSTTREISWISHYNTHPLGQPHCGPHTLSLHRLLRQKIAADTAVSPSPAGRGLG